MQFLLASPRHGSRLASSAHVLAMERNPMCIFAAAPVDRGLGDQGPQSVVNRRDKVRPWSAWLDLYQCRRDTLDKESVWDEGRSTSLSRW